MVDNILLSVYRYSIELFGVFCRPGVMFCSDEKNAPPWCAKLPRGRAGASDNRDPVLTKSGIGNKCFLGRKLRGTKPGKTCIMHEYPLSLGLLNCQLRTALTRSIEQVSD